MKILTVFAIACALMTLTRAAGKSKRSCPSGWSRYSSRCFHYVPLEMTWAQAERNCQAIGSHLASVHTAKEYYQIKNMITMRTHEYPETWIGGSDAQEESFWFWIDGSPLKFLYWCKGEPNNYNGKQDCMAINHGG
uniref:C-type lectin domain-containing protein n=1 Tax=Anabas testudineus TaxID=64144 RepID=A0A3Q1IGX4_ANATE